MESIHFKNKNLNKDVHLKIFLLNSTAIFSIDEIYLKSTSDTSTINKRINIAEVLPVVNRGQHYSHKSAPLISRLQVDLGSASSDNTPIQVHSTKTMSHEYCERRDTQWTSHRKGPITSLQG